MLKDFKAWLRRTPEFYALLGLLAAYLLLFFGLDMAVKEPRFILHSPLDDMIPFNEWFTVFYFLWFPIFPGSLLAFLLLDKADFWELCFVVFTGAIISFAAYIWLPTGLELRPEVLPRDNFFSRLMQFIWLVDSPRNVCPSLHCSISAAIALVTCRSRSLQGRTLLKAAVAAVMLLICLSTMFVKQHSVWDVFVGVGMSLLLFGMAEIWRKVKQV